MGLSKDKRLQLYNKLINAGVITTVTGVVCIMSTLGLAFNAEISRGKIIDKKDIVLAESLLSEEYMNYIASRRDELNQENMNGEITDNQFLQEIKYLKSYDSVKEQADILSEGVQEKIEEISQDEHEAKAKDRRAVYHVLANSALALAGVAFVDHYRKKYSRLNNKSCKSDFNDNIKLVNGVDSNDQMFLDL